MAIDVTLPNTKLISLKEAGEILGATLSTLERYISQGYGGKKLEIVWVGGRRKTTREAIHNFLSAHSPEQQLLEEQWISEGLKRYGLD
tara:strand:- start:616 stop:879 length:264 start_codon:yes stop_codon:yes gene_type:complete